MRNIALLLTLALLAVASNWPTAQAQQAERSIVFFHSAVDDPPPQGDKLRLRLFFMLKDRQNNTLTDLPEQQGQLAILDANARQLDALEVTVTKPNTPLAIALVLDNSGSMNQGVQSSDGSTLTTMQAAQRAALQAIEDAPPQSEFAIFSFAQQPELRQQQPLLRKDGQLPLIHDAINAITAHPPNTGNTCLSDAALSAIEHLNTHVGAAESRKVVLLFTDGRDKEGDNRPGNGNNCSSASTTQVINQARLSANTAIPIYVIGPCSNPDCSNIDRNQLDSLARGTLTAPAAIGPNEDILALFKQIMAAINSQWLVEAEVLARQGANTATLTVQLGNTQLPASIQFTAPANYAAQATVRVTLDQYDPDSEGYPTELTITDSQQLDEISIEVYASEELGQRINGQIYSFAEPGPTQRFILNSTGLLPNTAYFMRITGKHKNGSSSNLPILHSSGEARAFYQFTHQPGFRLTISDAEYNAAGSELLLSIKAEQFGKHDWRALIAAVEVRDVASNDPELATPLAPITDVLRIATPQLLRAAEQERRFSFSLRLSEQAQGVELVALDDKLFTRPPAPGLFNVLGQALGKPFVLPGIAIVLVGTIALVVYRLRPRQRPIPRPYNLPGFTNVVAPSAPPARAYAEPVAPILPTLPLAARSASCDSQITVVRPAGSATNLQSAINTPVPKQQPVAPAWHLVVRVLSDNPVRELHIRSFPCTIGRADTTVQIANDPKISRAHLLIALTPAGLVLRDTSVNGSFVGNERLAHNASIALHQATRVRLGPNTVVELEPCTKGQDTMPNIVALLALVALLTALPAATGQAQPQLEPHIELTSVDTTAFPQVRAYLAAHNHALPDPTTITVSEDGHAVAADTLAVEQLRPGVAVAVVIDLTRSMRGSGLPGSLDRLQDAREQTIALALGLRPDTDLFSVVLFNRNVVTLLPLAPVNGGDVANNLGNNPLVQTIPDKPAGAITSDDFAYAALSDGIARAIDVLGVPQTSNMQKVVVVFSDHCDDVREAPASASCDIPLAMQTRLATLAQSNALSLLTVGVGIEGDERQARPQPPRVPEQGFGYEANWQLLQTYTQQLPDSSFFRLQATDAAAAQQVREAWQTEVIAPIVARGEQLLVRYESRATAGPHTLELGSGPLRAQAAFVASAVAPRVRLVATEYSARTEIGIDVAYSQEPLASARYYVNDNAQPIESRSPPFQLDITQLPPGKQRIAVEVVDLRGQVSARTEPILVTILAPATPTVPAAIEPATTPAATASITLQDFLRSNLLALIALLLVLMLAVTTLLSARVRGATSQATQRVTGLVPRVTQVMASGAGNTHSQAEHLLVEQRGDSTGQQHALTLLNTYIGAENALVDIVLNDGFVSGRHASINRQGNDLYLTDLGSSNGTYLNDQRLSSNQACLLTTGDQIRIGGLEFAYLRQSQPPLTKAPSPPIHAVDLPTMLHIPTETDRNN